jgi:hypothetical protein
MKALLDVYGTLARLAPPVLDTLLPTLLSVGGATALPPATKQVPCEEPWESDCGFRADPGGPRHWHRRHSVWRR